MSLASLKKSQRGFSLIEVMVTVLLLATSLLSLAVMQNRSLQFNHESYLRSQANILAYDIIDRARANLNNMADYSLAFGATTPTGSTRAALDLSEWSASISTALPSGDGQILCDATTRVCSIGLRWFEREGADPSDQDESNQTTFTYQTVL